MRRKKKRQPPQSKQQLAARAEQRLVALAAVPVLLRPRSHARKMLSCSDATLIRLEESGRLKPIKRDPASPSSATLYTDENLRQVASGDAQ